MLHWKERNDCTFYFISVSDGSIYYRILFKEQSMEREFITARHNWGFTIALTSKACRRAFSSRSSRINFTFGSYFTSTAHNFWCSLAQIQILQTVVVVVVVVHLYSASRSASNVLNYCMSVTFFKSQVHHCTDSSL